MRAFFAIGLLFVSPLALATNSRSAVSINGSDTNLCTVASPCRSFSAAMFQTSVGGEIIALDTAGYGPFSINKSVTVSGAPGVHAAITVSTGTAIDIAAGASDRVTLRNLTLIGTGGGNTGINIGNVGILNVADVSISAFITNAIFAFGNVELIADHCDITDNIGATGIDLFQSTAAIHNSRITGNAFGVKAEDGGTAAVTNCLLAMNDNAGIETISFINGEVSAVLVESCEIVANNWGIFVGNNLNGGSSSIRLSNNAIFKNGTGVVGGTGGVIASYNNNRIEGNTTDLSPGTMLTSLTER